MTVHPVLSTVILHFRPVVHFSRPRISSGLFRSIESRRRKMPGIEKSVGYECLVRYIPDCPRRVGPYPPVPGVMRQDCWYGDSGSGQRTGADSMPGTFVVDICDTDPATVH